MSTTLGPVGYAVNEEHPFLGRDITEPRAFGEDTARQLDEEVRQLLRATEAHTDRILQEHHSQLLTITDALLERETLNHAEIAALLGDAPAPSAKD
jgi:cell division protease FtsH